MIILWLKDDQDSLLKVTNPNKRKLESEVKTESKVKEEAEEKSEIEERGEDNLLFTYPMDRENKQVRRKHLNQGHY